MAKNIKAKVNEFEHFLYEMRPHFYAALAVYAFSNYSMSKLMILSGSLLVISSYSVYSLRYGHRAKVIK